MCSILSGLGGPIEGVGLKKRACQVLAWLLAELLAVSEYDYDGLCEDSAKMPLFLLVLAEHIVFIFKLAIG